MICSIIPNEPGMGRQVQGLKIPLLHTWSIRTWTWNTSVQCPDAYSIPDAPKPFCAWAGRRLPLQASSAIRMHGAA